MKINKSLYFNFAKLAVMQSAITFADFVCCNINDFKVLEVPDNFSKVDCHFGAALSFSGTSSENEKLVKGYFLWNYDNLEESTKLAKKFLEQQKVAYDLSDINNLKLVLAEILNIAFGHVALKWAENGFVVNFEPPFFLPVENSDETIFSDLSYDLIFIFEKIEKSFIKLIYTFQ